MIEEVRKARRITARQLAVRLGLYERDTAENVRAPHELDSDTGAELLEGLVDAPDLPIYLIMGALCNPLMQKITRMVGEDLCTDHQAQQGIDELHRKMAQYYDF